MKITKKILERIIKEELCKLMNEQPRVGLERGKWPIIGPDGKPLKGSDLERHKARQYVAQDIARAKMDKKLGKGDWQPHEPTKKPKGPNIQDPKKHARVVNAISDKDIKKWRRAEKAAAAKKKLGSLRGRIWTKVTGPIGRVFGAKAAGEGAKAAFRRGGARGLATFIGVEIAMIHPYVVGGYLLYHASSAAVRAKSAAQAATQLGDHSSGHQGFNVPFGAGKL